MFVHGQLSYLQIPARDVVQSAAFYEAVFGWVVEPPQSFDAHGLFGQWVTDRPMWKEPALWIHVEDMDKALARIVANGGLLLDPPTPDGPERTLATFRDPAHNVLGIVAHAPR